MTRLETKTGENDYLEMLALELVRELSWIVCSLSWATGSPVLSVKKGQGGPQANISVIIEDGNPRYAAYFCGKNRHGRYPFEEPDSIQKLIDDLKAL